MLDKLETNSGKTTFVLDLLVVCIIILLKKKHERTSQVSEVMKIDVFFSLAPHISVKKKKNRRLPALCIGFTRHIKLHFTVTFTIYSMT